MSPAVIPTPEVDRPPQKSDPTPEKKAILWPAIISGAVGLIFGTISGRFDAFVARPVLQAEISELRLEAPPDLKVRLPLEPKLFHLSAQIPDWLLDKRPDLFAILLPPFRPPQNGFFGGNPLPHAAAIPIPQRFMSVNLTQLRDLHRMSDIPADVIREWTNQLEAMKDDPEFELLEKVAQQAAEGAKLVDSAKERIDEIESEFKLKNGEFVIELVITNSGQRSISVLSPAELHYALDGQTAMAPLMLEPANQPQSIGPNDSKRLMLRSHRADANQGNNRQLMQENWGKAGNCHIEFVDSDNVRHKTDMLKFHAR